MRPGTWIPVVVVPVLMLACGAPPPPVGRLEISPSTLELEYPAYESLRIRLEPSKPLDGIVGDPKVFVHLLRARGEVVRTFDHPLPGDWKPGQALEYEIEIYQSALSPPLATGTYLLSLGLYDSEGHRWTLEADGEQVDGGEYVVGEVSVPEEDEDVPMFYFTPGWQTIEGGVDLQILGRRWLVGSGEIRVGEITRPGTVRVRLAIPPVTTAEHSLEMTDDSDVPQVVVSSSCDDLEVCVAGPGSHTFELPIGVDEAGVLPRECELRLRPNFHVVARANPTQELTVQLENLSWGPARGEE